MIVGVAELEVVGKTAAMAAVRAAASMQAMFSLKAATLTGVTARVSPSHFAAVHMAATKALAASKLVAAKAFLTKAAFTKATFAHVAQNRLAVPATMASKSGLLHTFVLAKSSMVHSATVQAVSTKATLAQVTATKANLAHVAMVKSTTLTATPDRAAVVQSRVI